ncbi:anti-sigma factor domain-containing protein, partial [Jatrophihabitans sp. YIM 134969]
RRRRARGWLAAAAAVLVVGAGAGGYVVGRDDTSTGGCPTATAQLASVGGGSADAGGRAEVVCAADGPALRVTTEQLPINSGYYEVWMYQPSSGVMVAIGALGNDGSGTFTLPGGMDIRDYPVVDVSAQRFDGDPSHQQSVLQGPLTR